MNVTFAPIAPGFVSGAVELFDNNGNHLLVTPDLWHRPGAGDCFMARASQTTGEYRELRAEQSQGSGGGCGRRYFHRG